MSVMTDPELIGYCELHCETPVALFSPEQINRMLALAGHPPGFIRSTDRWMSLHSEMEELCALARQRLAAPTPSPDATPGAGDRPAVVLTLIKGGRGKCSTT